MRLVRNSVPRRYLYAYTDANIHDIGLHLAGQSTA